MQITYVDGMREELAKLQAIRPEQPLTVDWMLHDKKVTPQNLGKLVNALQLDALEKQPADFRHAGTKLMYHATSDSVVFDLVDQTPAADGSYASYARIEIAQQKDGQWALRHFKSSLDPSGFDKGESQMYVDLADSIHSQYKRPGEAARFAADFLTAAAQGNFMWDSLIKADLRGSIDEVFDDARKREQARLTAGEKPMAIFKTCEGRIPGTFEYSHVGATPQENRQSVSPVQHHRR